MNNIEALPKGGKAYSYEHLPLTPFKYEIAQHFGYAKTTHFFRNVFFRSILPESEYTYEKIKPLSRLPAKLAIEIYTTYKIERLNN